MIAQGRVGVCSLAADVTHLIDSTGKQFASRHSPCSIEPAGCEAQENDASIAAACPMPIAPAIEPLQAAKISREDSVSLGILKRGHPSLADGP